MIADQVHYEDRRDILTNAGSDELFLRNKVAKSIAMAYYDDRIRNRTEYSMLRAEVLEFCVAVRATLAPLTDARIKAWALEEGKELQVVLEKQTAYELKVKQQGPEKQEAIPTLWDWGIVEDEGELEDGWLVVNCSASCPSRGSNCEETFYRRVTIGMD